MEADFWIERWNKGEIGFHQAQGNDLLAKHWPAVGAKAGETVFVPLCGKSVDMVWLAAQGHRVVGSELSQLAVEEFFRSQAIEPEVRNEGAHTIYTAGAITIWRGDLFALPATATQPVSAVYDRAALVAMPADMRTSYANALTALAPTAPVLLISLDYPAGEISGPPFPTPESAVRALYSATYDIAVMEHRDGLATSPPLRDRGLTRLDESVYLLRPK